jgi:hypothetical protein
MSSSGQVSILTFFTKVSKHIWSCIFLLFVKCHLAYMPLMLLPFWDFKVYEGVVDLQWCWCLWKVLHIVTCISDYSRGLDCWIEVGTGWFLIIIQLLTSRGYLLPTTELNFHSRTLCCTALYAVVFPFFWLIRSPSSSALILAQVKVTLRLTGSQSINLGVEPHGAPSQTRGRVCHLSESLSAVISHLS